MSTVDLMNTSNEVINNKENRIKGEPRINVISKEEYEERVEKVFHILWEVLSKSFGPYGAPTLICNYPWTHVTKDGYTIMKNLSMDTSQTMVDQQIADMASDICGRLNYSVGDGTTSAVIATNSIYQSYRKYKQVLDDLCILPRDVVKRYNDIKAAIVDRLLSGYVVKPDLTNREELSEIIRNVVYISSNGDEIITDYISDLYYDLGCPAITCSLAPDGITKKSVIHGYKFEMSLLDRLYINSDEDVMWLQDADIIIFSTKITEEIYESILKPLNNACRMRGRRLVVAAPTYDEKMLGQSIKRDLTNEWAKTKKINMVLTSYRATSEHARRLVEDFAMLMNTIVIDRAMVNRLLADVRESNFIEAVFNIDHRDGLPYDLAIGVGPAKQIKEGNSGATNLLMAKDIEATGSMFIPVPLIENAVRIGYARKLKIGLTHTVVEDLFYDEDTYKVVLKEAKSLLDETRKKYQKLGTFNLAVTQAEQRYYALNLRMGSIEVGADSELSQKMLKDAVDDSIKAAASAYYHGVINGSNTVLIRIIGEMLEDDGLSEGDKVLLSILHKGFRDVYKTVLRNAFDDYVVEFPTTDLSIEQIETTIPTKSREPHRFDKNDQIIYMVIDNLTKESTDGFISIHDLIVDYSVATGTVFDLTTMEFTEDIINSAQTDIEILKATIDLITILIVGNQMVVTQKHNFE